MARPGGRGRGELKQGCVQRPSQPFVACCMDAGFAAGADGGLNLLADGSRPSTANHDDEEMRFGGRLPPQSGSQRLPSNWQGGTMSEQIFLKTFLALMDKNTVYADIGPSYPATGE